MEDFLRNLHDNFSIFPVKKDKSPVYSWSIYREKKIEFELLLKHKYFAIVCGFDNLEVIDIDNHFDDADNMYQFVCDNLPEHLLTTLPIIKTQGGGYHIYYKCETIEGNKKLASRINQSGRQETLIETRGAGGYVCAPPSKGYDVILNDILQVPTITIEDRKMILDICRSLNEIEKANTEPTKEIIQPIETGEKPGEKYNNDSSSINATIGLLQQHGWSTINNKHFKRPGKTTLGISATFGKVGVNKFYCFSSNAAPFEPETSYSMFGVYTMLEHNGNYSNAANALADIYGMKRTKQQPTKEIADIQEINTVVDKKQKKTASQRKWEQLIKILDEWNIKMRFNVLTKILEFNQNNQGWEQIGNLCNDIVKEMETNRFINSITIGKISDMIVTSDICYKYNPIDDFFKNLPAWDGKDYFSELMKYIVTQSEEDNVFFSDMFKKHIIRTVRCAIEESYVNRFVFIFYGPQEIGKSELIKWLCPRELYDDEMIDTSSKDSLLKLVRYLIVNLEELDSLQRKDVAKLKAFISKGEVNTRVAYGRFDERLPRVASLFGSTNKSDILADESNTRWLIVKVKQFLWKEYIKEINPLQIWSQAYAILKADINAGELTKEEKQLREQRNNQLFLETSSERELLLKWFEEGDELMTATDIKICIEQNLHPMKINIHQLGRELKRIFGESNLQSNGDKVGRYYKVKNNLSSNPMPSLNGSYELKKAEF